LPVDANIINRNIDCFAGQHIVCRFILPNIQFDSRVFNGGLLNIPPLVWGKRCLFQLFPITAKSVAKQ